MTITYPMSSDPKEPVKKLNLAQTESKWLRTKLRINRFNLMMTKGKMRIAWAPLLNLISL